jgi:hypothetical protein
MLLSILTQTIATVIRDIEPIDVKITTGCLLYSYLNNQENKIDLRDKALSFKDYYYSLCIERKIKNRTVGFINIERIINDKKIKHFPSISVKDYEDIIRWFNTIDLEVKFNPNDINPKTYGKIAFSSKYERDRFSELHNNFLTPIAKYYKNKYNISNNNLRIVNVSDTVIPAREITFFIDGYESLRVVQDITKGLILFNNKPTTVELTVDSLVRIII